MESSELRDSDWLPLRDAVPSFAPHWRKFVGEGFYNETLPSSNITELTDFVAREILPHNRDGLVAIGETLETMYTMAAFRDDESLEALLTIGFLENLIRAAEEYEIPLTRIQPLLAGPRTREQWDDAIAYRKPGFQWVDGVGALPVHPLPSRIGMIEVHRGWADRAAGVLRMDARLVSGELRPGYLVRREISKDHYTGWTIATVAVRSVDVSDEYHIEFAAVREEAYEGFDLFMSQVEHGEHEWEIAVPAADSPSA